MGRARGTHSAQAEKLYHQGLNGQEEHEYYSRAAARHDSGRAWYHAKCSNKLHVCYRSIDAVNDPRSTALRCRVCSKHLKKKPNQHEKRLYSLLGAMELEFATEVMLFPAWLDEEGAALKLSSHPTDVMLAKSGLLIEVDGEQHFEGEHNKKGWEEQQERDRMVDAAVLEVGYCCVRLHYLDANAEWKATIRAALQQLQQQTQPSQGCVHFSPAYKKPLTL